MTDHYLIAHKVRGEPAFDVAIRINCPVCLASDQADPPEGCHECDGHGYWWIIPTSGHRAYPWWYCPFIQLACDRQPPNDFEFIPVYLNDPAFPPMPPDLPDHYQHREAPKVSLAEALGLKPKPLPPIVRRL